MHNLLVVEDEPFLRHRYRHELEERGYRVTSVCTGKGALEKLHIDSFDLVVLDIRLPGINGLEVLERLRSEGMSIPVILNTSHSFYRQDRRCNQANGFIIKSPDTRELMDKVKELLG
jgi:CheY-like chemotaxis protein